MCLIKFNKLICTNIKIIQYLLKIYEDFLKSEILLNIKK